MSNWYADLQRPFPADLEARIQQDAAVMDRLYEQRPCARCGHRADYHGDDHCGAEVCAFDAARQCFNEMHGNGWCQCPGVLEV